MIQQPIPHENRLLLVDGPDSSVKVGAVSQSAREWHNTF